MISNNGCFYSWDMAVITVAEMCSRIVQQKAVLILNRNLPWKKIAWWIEVANLVPGDFCL